MKIITWNINSVRLRHENIKRLVGLENPDILCLQETKVVDELFPHGLLSKLGFKHIYFSGQKSYNGVAILSKIKLEGINKHCLAEKDHCRHISGFLPDGTEIHNFYVPAGGPDPDPVKNPNFAYKLKYVDEMTEWFMKNRKPNDKMILVGDLNIAPHEHDVWSHKQLINVVSHTAVEVEKFLKLQDSLSWVDSGRVFVPMDKKLYSWWSYRGLNWEQSDRGRRLDHIWLTRPLEKKLQSGYVVKEPRGWHQPSDHIPVVIEVGI